MDEKQNKSLENSDQITRSFIEDALDLGQRQRNLEKVEDFKAFQEFIASLPRNQRRKFIKEKFSDRIRNSFKFKNENKVV